MVLLALLSIAAASTYEVGPGKALAAIGEAPWTALKPGDTVLIHWRAEPYREKWVICLQGTAEAPITVMGVPGPNGELPVIDGADAVAAPNLVYGAELRGLLKIGGASIPANLMPRHIVVDGLEFRGARRENTFRNQSGAVTAYARNSSGIYLEKGEDIVIRNCVFRDNGNGLFVASNDDDTSREILIEGNWLFDNGNSGSGTEHNSYTAAAGITFQYNRYGPLRAGAGGNNLKDRSSGLVVRYNWIEGGNRQLDLVEAEDSIRIRADPRYRETFVYGNVLIETAGAGNRQVVHYGGDNGDEPTYRKGTLYFYSNTVISTRTDRTTLMRLSTQEERCDARNNIVYVSAPGDRLALLDEFGLLELAGNWMKPGWSDGYEDFVGTVIDNGTLTGESPGFADEQEQDFRLRADSEVLGKAVPANEVSRQYVRHRQSAPRTSVTNPGAFDSLIP